MKASIHLMLAFLHLGVFIKQGNSHKCRNIHANRNYRLNSHVIETIHGISPETCIMLCVKNSKCFSINHHRSKKLCEHNNKTKLFAQNDFVYDENCFYIEMLERDYDPCLVENPCKNDGKCSVHYNNGSYSCQCTQHYMGQHCETLKNIGSVNCQNEVLNLCQQHMKAWKARFLGPTSLRLENCSTKDVQAVSELLLFVARGEARDYGKYDIVRVKGNTGCAVILHSPIKMVLSGSPCEIVAQSFPNFEKVTVTQYSTLTCNARSGAVGGILAFRAVEVEVDSTSKIDMNGKGKSQLIRTVETETIEQLKRTTVKRSQKSNLSAMDKITTET